MRISGGSGYEPVDPDGGVGGGSGHSSPQAPGALDRQTEALVRVSASLATRDEERIRKALEEAREAAEPTAVEEILLQGYLFLGFPAALGALALWREVWGSGAPDPDGDPAADELARRMERGERICRIVYGGRYEALRENIRALHPDMERWMLEEGYGKVLSREGVDLAVRELAIAALLAVLGATVQLHSHVRGALHAGASPSQVEAALTVAGEYQTDEERRVARKVWERVRGR
ncbi:MAG: carboxymuconolactone decarboxylase family protein [Longimicrobiales bacterium]|nr:carboxymuconolactone decarboxylase family protein [Longimicrobiales bacterium]